MTVGLIKKCGKDAPFKKKKGSEVDADVDRAEVEHTFKAENLIWSK